MGTRAGNTPANLASLVFWREQTAASAAPSAFTHLGGTLVVYSPKFGHGRQRVGYLRDAVQISSAGHSVHRTGRRHDFSRLNGTRSVALLFLHAEETGAILDLTRSSGSRRKERIEIQNGWSSVPVAWAAVIAIYRACNALIYRYISVFIIFFLLLSTQFIRLGFCILMPYQLVINMAENYNMTKN